MVQAVDSVVRKESVEEQVWERLRSVCDPELPASIVDLGLVYGVEVDRLPTGSYSVGVQMTPDSPGREMSESLVADVERKVAFIRGVDEVCVKVVMDPPWTQEMFHQARFKLGLSDL